MAVRCFFSGVEGQQHYDACINAGARHLLTSFLYLQKKGDMDIVKNRKKKHPNIHWLIDSGAHTFQSEYGKYESWSRQDFENYVKSYADWLLKYRHYIFGAVELDIGYTLNMVLGTRTSDTTSNSTVGPAIVAEWQKKYFLPLVEKGVDICFVWHANNEERPTAEDMQHWEWMCQQFPYCGLPGELSKHPDFNKYMSVARRYSTKVHGFAATKQTDFRDWPWYSIDSITWKTCEMYGTLIDWDSRRQVLSFQEKPERFRYREKFEALGLDADGIINDTNYKEVTKYALTQMRAMEEFYENRYKDRTFYYEVRLPHPSILLSKSDCSQKEVWRLWHLLRPKSIFKWHQHEERVFFARHYLAAISTVQNSCAKKVPLTVAGKDFLTKYFPNLVKSEDWTAFQREMAMYLSPPAPPVQKRTDEAHFVPGLNQPRARDLVELSIEDLTHNPAEDYRGTVEI